MPKKQVKKLKKEKNTDLYNSVTTIPVLFKVNKSKTSVTWRRIEWYA